MKETSLVDKTLLRASKKKKSHKIMNADTRQL